MITTSGKQFLVRGNPVQFRGINAYCDPGNDGGVGQWGPGGVLSLFKR
jgi:hypothetical protein